jgi:hypothetical protein
MSIVKEKMCSVNLSAWFGQKQALKDINVSVGSTTRKLTLLWCGVG